MNFVNSRKEAWKEGADIGSSSSRMGRSIFSEFAVLSLGRNKSRVRLKTSKAMVFFAMDILMLALFL